MISGPLIPTAGEVIGREGPVCWVLTNEQRMEVPSGFAIAAHAVRRTLIPGQPAAVLAPSMWDQWKAGDMQALLLVSSVAASVSFTGGPGAPSLSHLSPRSSWSWRVDLGAELHVKAVQQWAGEVYAVPLRVIDLEAARRTFLGVSLPLSLPLPLPLSL